MSTYPGLIRLCIASERARCGQACGAGGGAPVSVSEHVGEDGGVALAAGVAVDFTWAPAHSSAPSDAVMSLCSQARCPNVVRYGLRRKVTETVGRTVCTYQVENSGDRSNGPHHWRMSAV